MIELSQPQPPDWEVEVELTAADLYVVLWAIDTMSKRIPATHKDAFESLKLKVRAAYSALKLL